MNCFEVLFSNPLLFHFFSTLLLATELKKNNIFHNEILQIGSKCMVTISDNNQYPAYIQDMQPDKGPVTVFVEVLGEMYVLQYSKRSIEFL